LHKIPDLHPKYYLHFLGVNDAKLPPLRRLRTGMTSWGRWIRPRSAIAQAAVKLRAAFAAPIIVNHKEVVPPKQPQHVWIEAAADRSKLATYVEQTYKPNLRVLLDVHARRNEKVIFVSQSANPLIVKDQNGAVFVTIPGLAEWAVALHAINAATGQVCGERPAQCRFVDLAGSLPLDAADFYDLVHYTPKGARAIGTFLAKELAFVQAPHNRPAPAHR
jgi:hypothetical protein